MRALNLTSHPLTLVIGGGRLTIQPEATPARVNSFKKQIAELEVFGLPTPINVTTYGDVTGLPAPEDGTIYIVSLLVAQALRGTRDDVLIVDDTVRDEQGRIVGARGLARVYP